MPDVNYIITIRQEGGSGGESSGGVAPTPSGVKTANKNAKSGNDFAAFGKVAVAYAAVKKIGDAVIVPEINRVELRTGHETMQGRYNFAYNTATSLLGSAVAGFAAGGVAGAAISVALNVGAMMYKTTVAQTNLDIARAVENEGIRLANIRATSGGNRIGRDS